MHYNISFPNLGIYLEHVGKNVSVFGFEIAYYGIIIGCAILIGFMIATSEAKRTRQNPDDYLDMGKMCIRDRIMRILMIVAAVILSGVLPGMPAFQDAAGNARGIHIFGEVS